MLFKVDSGKEENYIKIITYKNYFIIGMGLLERYVEPFTIATLIKV